MFVWYFRVVPTFGLYHGLISTLAMYSARRLIKAWLFDKFARNALSQGQAHFCRYWDCYTNIFSHSTIMCFVFTTKAMIPVKYHHCTIVVRYVARIHTTYINISYVECLGHETYGVTLSPPPSTTICKLMSGVSEIMSAWTSFTIWCITSALYLVHMYILLLKKWTEFSKRTQFF